MYHQVGNVVGNTVVRELVETKNLLYIYMMM